MDFEETGISGCLAVRARLFRDDRGSFVKTFHEPTFRERSLRTDWKEEYYSSSKKGVVRGMHFQLPPSDHAKLVFCVQGSVLDVVLDLRRGSPTYTQHRSLELTSDNAVGLYIPTGCAHGFVALSEIATMYYKVTSIHSPEHEAGISWDSFGFEWPVYSPTLSNRDLAHPALDNFESPFLFNSGSSTR